MKLFQKLIAAPAIISIASGFAVNATEINNTDLGQFSNSSNLVSLGDFKSDTLFPGDWAYDSLKNLTNSPKFDGNSISRLEAAVELNNLIAGGEGLMNGAAIDRLSDELGSELAIVKGRVDGLEARINGLEAGSFTETTTMKGKAKFMIGAADGPDGSEEAVSMNYFWEVDLNTSFTGDDKLNVEIETGNTPEDLENGLLSITDFGKDSGDALKVSDLNYTFPLAGWKLTVGDSLDASKQFTGACAFDNVVDSLSDCGTGNSIAVGGDQTISAGYDLDNGFSFGLGISAEDGENASLDDDGEAQDHGIFTESGEDIVALNVAYSADQFGIALAYADVDVATYWGLNASYSPESVPFTISGGIELGEEDDGTETTQWAAGLSTDLGEGTLSAGLGTDGSYEDDATYAYELSYEFPINDGMKAMPFVAIVEGGDDVEDTTIAGMQVTFKF